MNQNNSQRVRIRMLIIMAVLWFGHNVMQGADNWRDNPNQFRWKFSQENLPEAPFLSWEAHSTGTPVRATVLAPCGQFRDAAASQGRAHPAPGEGVRHAVGGRLD